MPRRNRLKIFREVVRSAVLAMTVVLSVGLAIALRFEFAVPEERVPVLLNGMVVALLIKMVVLHLAKMHCSGWRYTELGDIRSMFWANLVASVIFGLTCYFVVGPGFPRSVYIIDFLLCFVGMAGTRFAVRFYHEPGPLLAGEWKGSTKNILVYGAGLAGRSLVREITSNRQLDCRVRGFLDDDADKYGMVIHGIRVFGRGRHAAVTVEGFRRRGIDIHEIVIAMPSATKAQFNEAIANCRAAGVNCKTVPGYAELLSGKIKPGEVRDLPYSALLGREPVSLDLQRVRQAVRGRTVLVTGGGGSIGSELCRQLVAFNPKKLLILDQAESDLFRIYNEVTALRPACEVQQLIGDIRNRQRVEEVFAAEQIDMVYHAAAYKHVPIMESHPVEAVETNVLGTYHLADVARKCNVSSFLMISSDKAVNPTNIMGLTKRAAELVVSSMPKCSTTFVSVRFGNVLGSNGSVVPIFRQQIANGGPVTITHPEMRRYFMTIPEAVQLVLEASPIGNGGEIFVLDMGEPVKLVDLARRMIELSGSDDIEIRYIGLRPGEKLFEELHCNGELMMPTHHPKIKIFAGPQPQPEAMSLWRSGLTEAILAREAVDVVRQLAAIVPEYTPSGQWRDLDIGEQRQTAAFAD